MNKFFEDSKRIELLNQKGFRPLQMDDQECLYAKTLAWLRETHNYNVTIMPEWTNGNDIPDSWIYSYIKLDGTNNGYIIDKTLFKTYREAQEAAIDFLLTHI